KAHAQVDPAHVSVVTDAQEIADASFVVEAVVEDHDVKATLLSSLHELLGHGAVLATTTSSLSIERLARESGRADRCVGLGAGHPMGPLALLDLVGLDVAAAIGRTIGAQVPGIVEQLIAQDALGRKSGRGFHDYGPRKARS